MEPNIRPSDQILIVGKNGQGKSVLALYLFCMVKSQKICVNVKRDPDLAPFLLARYGKDNVCIAESVDQLDFSKRVLLYQMSHSTGPACIAEVDELYARLIRRRAMTIWLDEAYGPTESGRVPPHLSATLTQGRSRNLRHIACTQRPVRIARPLLTEAHHIVWFPRGFNAGDRKFLADEMGVDEQRLREYAASVLQEEHFGEYGHLHYEQRKHTIHRRPVVPHP